MRKKVLAIVFVIALAAASLLGLVACNDSGINGLAYEKKYIYQTYLYYRTLKPTKERYYIFHKNGECEYRFIDEEIDTQEYWVEDEGRYITRTEGTVKIDYTVKYNYTFANDKKSATVYLSDGEIIDNSTYTDANGNLTPLKDTEWYKNHSSRFINEIYVVEQITVSANVISPKLETGYLFYFNEDYANELPALKKSNIIQILY